MSATWKDHAEIRSDQREVWMLGSIIDHVPNWQPYMHQIAGYYFIGKPLAVMLSRREALLRLFAYGGKWWRLLACDGK